ncbi:MAG: Uma2 family endonuclease [Chthoniobacteraceae bacterium]
MVAELLSNPKRAKNLAPYFQPALIEGGVEPEQRVVFGGVGWQHYLEIDKELGDDRPGPRMYFLDGDIEIVTTSNEHERIKKTIGGLIEIFLDERQISTMPRGQATMRILEKAGAEPDESYCIGEEKQWPDIVLEVALSTGGLPKLEVYQRFAIPEVWLWRRGHLEIHALSGDGAAYDRKDASGILPALPIELIERCVVISDWLEARRAFRSGLAGR